MAARLDPRQKAVFAECASPEAIAEHITTAQADLRKLTRHLEWLQELHGRRVAEKAAGTWPAADERSA